jgi:hypothetical protein
MAVPAMPDGAVWAFRWRLTRVTAPALAVASLKSGPGLAGYRLSVDTLFDRRAFKAFTGTVGIYPLVTVLRLRSNRLAVVCGQNEADPLRPLVMVFFSVSQSKPLPTELVDLRHSEEAVVALENAADWGYTDGQLMGMYAGAE